MSLPGVVETAFWFPLPAQDAGAPWPVTLALHALRGCGAELDGAPRVLGRGRGLPLLAAYVLRWAGMAVDLEMRSVADGVELRLALPPQTEWPGLPGGEDQFWQLVDEVAAAVDAAGGILLDGEAPIPGAAPAQALRRHTGVLVPTRERHLVAPALASAYRELPASGLVMLLR